MTWVDDLVSRIRAAVPAGVVVYDGLVPETPPARYVVVYADDGQHRSETVCGKSDSVTLRATVISVGVVPLQSNTPAPIARGLSRLVKRALLGVKLTDPDFACGPTEHEYGAQPQRDETVMDRAAVSISDLFRILASRL